MNKKNFLQKKYEEINRLKMLILDYPKEPVDSIVKSINNVCDEIDRYLDKNKSKENKVKVDSNYKHSFSENKEIKKNCDNTSINEIILTKKQLAEFDGKDGKPAYIAVDGVIYDLTKISKWKDGKHHGISAGQELTKEYHKHHNKKLDLIKKAKKIGRLKDEIRQNEIFTKEELSKYDGKNGMPAYAAVNGVVYDLTKILQWQGGNHYGLMAGQDLTEYFLGCHSDNLNILKNGVIVGKLKEEREVLPEYTVEDLAKFNGEQGELAYVAVNGTVYDVTNINQWGNGSHYGLVAGKDLTEFFSTCHKNSQKILDKLKVVGKIKN